MGLARANLEQYHSLDIIPRLSKVASDTEFDILPQFTYTYAFNLPQTLNFLALTLTKSSLSLRQENICSRTWCEIFFRCTNVFYFLPTNCVTDLPLKVISPIARGGLRFSSCLEWNGNKFSWLQWFARGQWSGDETVKWSGGWWWRW